MTYLEVIICPIQFNHSKMNRAFKAKRDVFDLAVRNFSVRAFADLMDDPLYCLIYQDFYESGDFESLYPLDRAMRASESLYREISEEIYLKAIETISL